MKGRPLVKQGYEQELSSMRAFVSMQNKSDSSGGASSTDHGVSGVRRLLASLPSGSNRRFFHPIYVCIYIRRHVYCNGVRSSKSTTSLLANNVQHSPYSVRGEYCGTSFAGRQSSDRSLQRELHTANTAALYKHSAENQNCLCLRLSCYAARLSKL